jgi:hypothetical protein
LPIAPDSSKCRFQVSCRAGKREGLRGWFCNERQHEYIRIVAVPKNQNKYIYGSWPPCNLTASAHSHKMRL